MHPHCTLRRAALTQYRHIRRGLKVHVLRLPCNPFAFSGEKPVVCEFRAFDLKWSCIDSRLTLTIKLTMVLALILLISLPRRLLEPSKPLFICYYWGGGYYSNPGALKAPPQPSQKKQQKPTNLKAKLIVFLSASRHVFFHLIEPASKRTQEHVQGHIVLK